MDLARSQKPGARSPGARLAAPAVAFACALALGVLAFVVPLRAQMDLTKVSGQPLPSPDLPAGTITVRVIRGTITNNVPNQDVDVTVDGAVRHLRTDASGHVEVSDLKPGTRVKAATVVDGERIESKDITIGPTGIRVMLVAGLGGAGASPGSAPAAMVAPVSGTVSFGPESRIVAEMSEDRLNVYFLMDIVNSAQTPVDIGGPVILELPREARGAALLQDSTRQATVNGNRVTVTGPFPAGKTAVRVGFEFPVSGGTAHISSKLPASLPQVIVIVGQVGGLDLASPQIAAKREVTDEGQRILVGTGPGLRAGDTLTFDITGVPHHATWPRYLALTLAGAIMATGVWAAATARPRRKRA